MADDVKVEADDVKTNGKLPESPKPLVTRDPAPKEVMPTEKPLTSKDAKEAADLHTQIQDILKEHGGVESNVPHNHNYWQLLNRFRTLVNKRKV